MMALIVCLSTMYLLMRTVVAVAEGAVSKVGVRRGERSKGENVGDKILRRATLQKRTLHDVWRLMCFQGTGTSGTWME